jgi:hypothetical protein
MFPGLVCTSICFLVVCHFLNAPARLQLPVQMIDNYANGLASAISNPSGFDIAPATHPPQNHPFPASNALLRTENTMFPREIDRANCT